VRVRLADLEPSPDVFAAVMATGILSVAAAQHEYRQISEMLGILATLGLAVLVVLVIVTRRFAAWDLKDPDVTLRLFTFVAACAVLDSRLADEPSLACALGVAALVSWLVLIALSARNMSSHPFAGLRDDAHGAWELASVGTSGLAIVATKVALNTSAHWVLQAALPIWVTALCIYGLMTWLVLWRTVAERQDRDGFEPDTWILMGGLTIATLAGDNIRRLAGRAGARGHRGDLGGGHALDTAADLLRPAPDQQPPRNAALRRRVVGVRLSAGYVLRGHLHDGDRDRAAIVAHGFAGLLLGRVGRVAHCHPRRTAARLPCVG
jgi:hypothetical protein